MPKGGKSSLLPVNAGLREDLDQFLKAFLAKKFQRYTDYKNLFASIGMAKIFSGRSYYAEVIEFNENILDMCLDYIQPYYGKWIERRFEERLFGLYSLYTFFFLQQIDHVVKIQMDPDMQLIFQNFLEFLKINKHIDAWACGMQLINNKAIKIVAFRKTHDPLTYKRFLTDINMDDLPIFINLNDPLGNVRNLLNNDTFITIDVVHKKILELRKKCGLNQLMNELSPTQEILKEITQNEKIFEMNILPTKNKPISNIVKARNEKQIIKEKVFTSKLQFARSQRHRTNNQKNVDEKKILFDFSESNDEDNINQNPINKITTINKILENLSDPIIIEPLIQSENKNQIPFEKKKTPPENPSAKEKGNKKRKYKQENNETFPLSAPEKKKKSIMNSTSAEDFFESLESSPSCQKRSSNDLKMSTCDINISNKEDSSKIETIKKVEPMTISTKIPKRVRFVDKPTINQYFIESNESESLFLDLSDDDLNIDLEDELELSIFDD